MIRFWNALRDLGTQRRLKPRRGAGVPAEGRALSYEHYEQRLALSGVAGAEAPPKLQDMATNRDGAGIVLRLNSFDGQYSFSLGAGAKVHTYQAQPLPMAASQNVAVEGGFVAPVISLSDDIVVRQQNSAVDFGGRLDSSGFGGDGWNLDDYIYVDGSNLNSTNSPTEAEVLSGDKGLEAKVIAPPLDPVFNDEGGAIALSPSGSRGLWSAEQAAGLANVQRDGRGTTTADSRLAPGDARPIESLRARAVVFEVADADRAEGAEDPTGLATRGRAGQGRELSLAEAADARRGDSAESDAAQRGERSSRGDLVWRDLHRNSHDVSVEMSGGKALADASATLAAGESTDAKAAASSATKSAASAHDAALAAWERDSALASSERDGVAAAADSRNRKLVGAAVAVAIGAGSLGRRLRRGSGQATEELPPRRR